MRVLVVGGGGREHALCWRIAQSPLCSRLFCAPGNPGIERVAECVPLAAGDVSGLVEFARTGGVDLVVVGPEIPLVAGLADDLRQEGIAVFGPSAGAAEIEGSKAAAKALMARLGVPTAAYRHFTRYDEARAYLDACDEHGPRQLVVKAVGLAAGKGVIVCDSILAARAAVQSLMLDLVLGPAGAEVVIEERLWGPEASLLVLTDGQRGACCPPAQDYKPVGEGDTGPNTGGMGAFAPTPALGPEAIAPARERIVDPVLAALAGEGRPFVGCLYAGLMVTGDGPQVIEFNCRFGDPEAQAILPLLESDLLELMAQAAAGQLPEAGPRWSTRSAVCVVLASGGYPQSFRTGMPVSGLEAAAEVPGALVFHAGTAASGGEVVTAGGRVLNVVGVGDNMAEARRRAYEAAGRIRFEGVYYRRDIAGAVSG